MVFYNILPKSIPTMVEKPTTNKANVTVFLRPRILFITKRLGTERAGPAKRSANAGPFAIPRFIVTIQIPCDIDNQ
jgi:hypothetical protein